MMKHGIMTLGFCALLAGCGGAQGDGKTADGGGKGGAALADWDATDACARLDKAALGAALGDTVTETDLSFVHHAMGGGDAATSRCTYTLASGGRAKLATRNSPINDNTPASMALMRKTAEEALALVGYDKTIEDVPGLGKSAFFVPAMNEMSVFLDDARYVELSIDGPPPEKVKQITTELIRKMAK